jgi:arylformamidase
MELHRCIDLSLALSPDMMRYPGDPAPQLQTLASLEQGDPLTVSQLTINCHVGTHVDAPAHFLASGATVDQLSLEHFYGAARVVQVGGTGPITPADLNDMTSAKQTHILLKTGNSALLSGPTFEPSYRTLTAAAAEGLVALQPLSVGFDYYSLDPPAGTIYPAHLILAQAGIPVFLPLRLAEVEPGDYLFVAMPLPLVGVEAAPVRAVLFTATS